MFEYYENKLAVQANWLFGAGAVMSEGNYKKLRQRKQVERLRPNAPGQPALIDYNSLPERFKRKVEEKVGDPHKMAKRKGLEDMIHRDGNAVGFFANYLKPNGDTLTEERQLEYIASAEVLKAVGLYVRQNTARTGASGRLGSLWNTATKMASELRDKLGHGLPSNARRMREKYNEFERDGYRALVHRGLGNVSARKVTERLELLILCLYANENRPFKKTVLEEYLLFVAGEIDVADPETGEVFDRQEFYKDGKPIQVSESTVWNILSDPRNKIWVDKYRMDAKEYNDTHVPHAMRKKPKYSLTKISLDDRDLPRKALVAGKAVWVKAYYAYDVNSHACIGASWSLKKDANLFIDCFVDMFRFLHKANAAMPLEVEVEHHIASLFRQDLLAAGNLFPYVRWCAPTNSQEKHAEHFNNSKKYGFEKRYQEGIGRWYAKSEAKRTRQDKTWDKEGMKVKQKVYQYDRLVADDMQVIAAYNNAPHPDQKLYKGKTRLQVFLENQNPDAPTFAPHTIAKYVGVKVETSIRRSKYLRANNAHYELPNPSLMAKLSPNNYKVDAYYMPTPDDVIPEVHVYQNDKFISTCAKTELFQGAKAEQTDADFEIMGKQSTYLNQFKKLAKDENPVQPVVILNNNDIEPEAFEIIAEEPAEDAMQDSTEFQNEEALEKAMDF